MVKKVLACLLLLLVAASGAFGEVTLYHVHRSIAGLTDGHSDYSDARFLTFYVSASDWDGSATQADVNLTGTMTFSGGNYSFWNGRNGGMLTNSGTSRTFGLVGESWMTVGSSLEYSPRTVSGDDISFCLSDDGGLSGVNVSWNLSQHSGQETIPNYMTTQQQLATCVPYIEFIRSGTQVTGFNWRAVNPSDTSTPVPQNHDMNFCLQVIYDENNNEIYDMEEGNKNWQYINANTPPQGTVMFTNPIDEAKIYDVHVYLNHDSDNSNWATYRWHFCKPSTPETWLYESPGFDASLVNGKSDYSNAKFAGVYFDIDADEGIIAEARHFTAEGSVTIPGGGYTLGDDNVMGDENTPGKELETIPAGTDKTFKLRMHRGVAPGDTYLEYQPVDENGVNLEFRREAETSLPGKTITWIFPAELNLSGSATISSFKSTAQQLAEGVPYIELVSADGKLTAVNFKVVTASDTSTAVTPSYRTDFRIRFDRITPDTTGSYYQSSWFNNRTSGTWTLGNPQDLSNMDSITVRYRTWEDPNKSILYSWFFITAEAPAPIEITTATLPSGTTGSPYTAALAANITGVTWSVSSGTLPAGLTLNPSTGAITGTPTSTGTSTFTVMAVKDSESAEKHFSIAVNPVTPAPTITITTDSLPSGTAGTAYSAVLAANVSGASWSVISGTLPDGLTLNSSTGAITGTPTATGTSNFTVRAVSGTQSAEKSFTITVNAPQSLGGSSGGGCESFAGVSGLVILAALFRKLRYSA